MYCKIYINVLVFLCLFKHYTQWDIQDFRERREYSKRMSPLREKEKRDPPFDLYQDVIQRDTSTMKEYLTE